MADILVPRYIITQLCMPSGRRTAKKPVLVVEEKKESFVRRLIPHWGTFEDKSEVYKPYTCHKIWDNSEYRYWAMQYSAGTLIAECRCCGHLEGRDYKRRREHFEKAGCAKTFDKACHLLLRDGVCAICDQKCFGKQKWGVPLCSPACQQAWCETEPQPDSLKAALALSGGGVWD